MEGCEIPGICSAYDQGPSLVIIPGICVAVNTGLNHFALHLTNRRKSARIYLLQVSLVTMKHDDHNTSTFAWTYLTSVLPSSRNSSRRCIQIAVVSGRDYLWLVVLHTILALLKVLTGDLSGASVGILVRIISTSCHPNIFGQENGT